MATIEQHIKYNNRLFDIYSVKPLDLYGIKFHATHFVDGPNGLTIALNNEDDNAKLLSRLPWIQQYAVKEPVGFSYSIKNVYSSDDTTSLYLTLCDMLLKSDKKHQTYPIGTMVHINSKTNTGTTYYRHEFNLSNMDLDLTSMSYDTYNNEIHMSYHDKENDSFYSDYNMFLELVDKYYTGLTSSQQQYIFDHILVFDTY